MRATIIAGNWKLNCTLDEAERLARGVMDAALDAPHRQVVLFPPFTALERVGKVARLGPANLFVGGQDLYWAENGAYTGEGPRHSSSIAAAATSSSATPSGATSSAKRTRRPGRR